MLKSIIVYLHLLLTCLAVGMVIYADGCFFRRRRKRISEFVRWLLVEMQSFFIYVLVGLWVTGLALTALGYFSEGSTYLQNEKLQAKIIIMVILTLNAVIMHRITFPILDRTHSFSTLPQQKKIFLLMVGSISTGSWTFLAYLGIARFMNNTFSVDTVFLLYAVWILLFFVVSLVLFMGKPKKMG